MRILNNLSHLPRATNDKGNPPSSNPFAVETLARVFDENYAANNRNIKELAIPEAGPYRASYSTIRCDRALWYTLTNTERSNEPTVADRWTWFLGQIVHEALQPILIDAFPGADEVSIDLNSIGIAGSAHADLVIQVNDQPTVIEITTVNGFKFKRMACRFNGSPEGPAYGKVMQALIAAKAANINQVVIMVMSLEKLSPSLAAQFSSTEASRFLAEWHYTVEEMSSQIDAEVARINHISRLAELNVMPEREIHDPEYPNGAIVTDPAAKPHATWQLRQEDNVLDAGTYWGCNYCPFQTTCIQENS